MNAEIIAIGDEITSGQTLDTNSRWLSQRLGELGVRVLYHTTVGDELQPCAMVFRQAIDRADVVVVTGGLGPTADDLTRDALAQAADRPLLLVPEALEHIRALFARRNRPMPRQNEVQAMFPAGSRVIRNPHGTAPGIDLEVPRPGRAACRLFALPGVPAEMFEMWASVTEALRGMGAGVRRIRRHNINCFGAGESQVEAMLPDLIRRGRVPTVGITASDATIVLRIAAEGASEAECAALIEPVAETIRQHLGSLVFGEGDEQLQDALARLLHRREKTLATVEIGTAGLVAQWLGNAAGMGERYRGGLVASTASSLLGLLGIAPDLCSRYPLASREVAQSMAVACRERFAADYGLAVSGFPEPLSLEPRSAETEVGSVFFALAGPDWVRHKQIPFALHPALLTTYCAKHALNLARLALSEKEPLRS